MKESVLEVVRCPVTGKRLAIERVDERNNNEILRGALRVEGEDLLYPIDLGVPNLSPDASFQHGVDDGGRKQTNTTFSYKWSVFDDFGFHDKIPDGQEGNLDYWNATFSDTQRIFKRKALFRPGDMGPGKNVLDVGCGTGRLVNLTRQSGATVFGVDISEGVYKAFERVGREENVHIVRGDLLHLPFPDGTFDAAYCIGVIQHCGDAAKGVTSICRTLGSGGKFALNCYGKGMFTYEFVDAWIRKRTIAMDIEGQRRFSRRLAKFDQFFFKFGAPGRFVHQVLNTQIHLKPSEHHIYDWYSPTFAAHFTPKEVLGWFRANGMKIEDAVPPIHNSSYSDLIRTIRHQPMNVLGVKP